MLTYPRCRLTLLSTRPGLPKRFQSFLFFQIHKPNEFKQRLKQFTAEGYITTAAQACEMKEMIAAEKKHNDASGRKAPLLPLPGVNIAFSSTGLHKVCLSRIFTLMRSILTHGFLYQLGKFVQVSDQEAVKRDRLLNKKFRKNQIRGGLFEKGMFDDLVGEGWDNPQEIRTQYQPLDVAGKKVRQIDGVLTVTSSVESDIAEQVERVTNTFIEDGVVSLPLVRKGHVRPEPYKGREQ